MVLAFLLFLWQHAVAMLRRLLSFLKVVHLPIYPRETTGTRRFFGHRKQATVRVRHYPLLVSLIT